MEVGRGRGGRGKGQERRDDPPVLPGVLKSSPAEPESLPQPIPTLPHKLELPGPSEAPNSKATACTAGSPCWANSGDLCHAQALGPGGGHPKQPSAGRAHNLLGP